MVEVLRSVVMDTETTNTSLSRLETERNVWLATVRPDGRPHVAPVWFVYVDDRLWIGTGAGSVRVANLRSDPSFSAALEDGNRPLVAEGRARAHEARRPGEVVAAFSAKYGWDITVEVDDDVGTVVLLELCPHRWLFGAGLPVVPKEPSS